MHLNVSKTKAMLISPVVPTNVYRPLIAGDKYIQYVNTFNYLGVLIDDQISFTPYYHLVKRRLENKIFIFSNL